MRADRLGDLMISLPAFAAVRTAYPDARIIAVVSKGLEKVLENSGWADAVIALPGGWLRRLFVMVRCLGKEKPDLGIDLMTGKPIWAAAGLMFGGARKRIGVNRWGSAAFYTANLPLINPRDHLVDIEFSILKLAFDPGAPGAGKPHVPEKPANDFANALEEWFPGRDDPVIGLHPGAHHPSQRWPADYFAQVADTLKGRGFRCIILGGLRETTGQLDLVSHGQTSVYRCDDVISLMGAVSMLDCLVCNISGPLHVAGAIGTPTVSVMGPSDPYMFWPVGAHDVVLRKPPQCAPCSKAQCGNPVCLTEIKPSEVVQAVLDNLKKAGRWNG